MNVFLRLSCLAFTFAAALLTPSTTRVDAEALRPYNRSGAEEVTSAPENGRSTLAFYIPRPLRGSQAFYIPRPLRGPQA
jgi:hypothetical protein